MTLKDKIISIAESCAATSWMLDLYRMSPLSMRSSDLRLVRELWDFQMPDPVVDDGLVSVIVTSHKQDEYISDALRSVRDQTYKDIELIVVDNGRQGRAAAIEDTLRQGRLGEMLRDGRIQIMTTQESLGQHGARNLGLQAAHGRYTTFLDGDDWLMPDMLSTAVGMLRQKPYAVLASPDCYLVEDGKVINRRVFGPVDPELFDRCNFMPISTVYRTEARGGIEFKPIVFGTEGQVTEHEDHRFWRELLQQSGGDSAYMPLPLFFYRQHGSNVNAYNLRENKHPRPRDKRNLLLTDSILYLRQGISPTMNMIGKPPQYVPQ